MVAWISRGALPVVTFICPLKPSLALLTAAEQLLPEPFAREPCRLADKQFLQSISSSSQKCLERSHLLSIHRRSDEEEVEEEPDGGLADPMTMSRLKWDSVPSWLSWGQAAPERRVETWAASSVTVKPGEIHADAMPSGGRKARGELLIYTCDERRIKKEGWEHDCLRCSSAESSEAQPDNVAKESKKKWSQRHWRGKGARIAELLCRQVSPNKALGGRLPRGEESGGRVGAEGVSWHRKEVK